MAAMAWDVSPPAVDRELVARFERVAADYDVILVSDQAETELGVSLTESYQLVPEQSTAAIVVHHPDAKYYSVGNLDRTAQILGEGQ